jgi:hypothetical protein
VSDLFMRFADSAHEEPSYGAQMLTGRSSLAKYTPLGPSSKDAAGRRMLTELVDVGSE